MITKSHLAVLVSLALPFSGFAAAGLFAQAAPAKSEPARVEHAVAGEVKKVDHAAKTVVVHTADGAEETLRFTETTTVHGVAGVAHVADHSAKAGLEGGSVVLHYVGNAADRTAVRIDHLGKRTLKTMKGTVVRMGDGGKTVVLKTASGAEETYDLGKHAVIDGGKGVGDAAGAAGHAIKAGTEVTVHYSDEAGKKLVHLLKHA